MQILCYSNMKLVLPSVDVGKQQMIANLAIFLLNVAGTYSFEGTIPTVYVRLRQITCN